MFKVTEILLINCMYIQNCLKAPLTLIVWLGTCAHEYVYGLEGIRSLSQAYGKSAMPVNCSIVLGEMLAPIVLQIILWWPPAASSQRPVRPHCWHCQ